ncbi:hypothetical protein FRC16_011118 [Serendipita sp. 398]|nr:hypothetical protein FRC16_011118 [Serendipita sp. 398]
MIPAILWSFTLFLGALAATTTSTEIAAILPTLSPSPCTITYGPSRLFAVRDDTKEAYSVRLLQIPDDTSKVNVTHMIVQSTSPCTNCGTVPTYWSLTKNVLTAKLPSTPSGWTTANLNVTAGTSPSFVTSPTPVRYPIYCAQTSSLLASATLTVHGTAQKFYMCDLYRTGIQFHIIYDISFIRPAGPCYQVTLTMRQLLVVDPPSPTLYGE